MIIEFKCKNFLSFKNEMTINFTCIEGYNEHSKSNLISTKRKNLSLLKSLAVYGSNGGGKSNITSALTLMDSLVHNSFKNSLSKEEDRKIWDCYFKLCPETLTQPTMFEVSFMVEDIIYRYGFEMYNWMVVSEWLYKTEKRETLLFERIGKDFRINEKSFLEGKRYEEVNSNVLFISHLAQYNGSESSKVFSFFNNLNIIDGLEDNHILHVTKQLLKNDDLFKHWLSLAIKFLEINSVFVSSSGVLMTKHPVYDKSKVLTGFVDFNLDTEESEGTKKLIYLLGAIYDTIKWKKVFWIDEFDSKLHPNLSIKLVKLFHEFNLNAAQFLITAHDPTLLDKDLFRRDQIWFVDKDQFGVSELYPMSNFKATEGLRSMADFRKKYLRSDFGAAESLELSDEFIELTKQLKS